VLGVIEAAAPTASPGRVDNQWAGEIWPSVRHLGPIVSAPPHAPGAVPMRSPFRYPGGKSWLVPLTRRWLARLNEDSIHDLHLVEPFAGGASVGLDALFEGLTGHLTLVELDADVAAVWQDILGGDAERLAARIVEFAFCGEAVEECLAQPPACTVERAFQTILRNRVNHGGILARRAGRIRHGDNWRGMGSRWYPTTLAARIAAIAARREYIQFRHDDGLAIIQARAGDRRASFFIDPPYTVAGKKAGARLYTHAEIDHQELLRLAALATPRVVITYDDTLDVRRLACSHGYEIAVVEMATTKHTILQELILSHDLGWADEGHCRSQLGKE
jgi:DNA adenine methylase